MEMDSLLNQMVAINYSLPCLYCPAESINGHPREKKQERCTSYLRELAFEVLGIKKNSLNVW